MKVCPKNRKLIAWMVLDELSGAEATELRTHFEHCSGCRHYHAQMLSVTQRLESLPSMATSEVESEVLISSDHSAYTSFVALHSRVKQARFTGAWAWRLTMPTMAIALLTLLVVVTLNRQVPFSNPTLAPTLVRRDEVSADEILPTLANYRALVNDSVERFDAVLSEQGRKGTAPTMRANSGVLALLNISD